MARASGGGRWIPCGSRAIPAALAHSARANGFGPALAVPISHHRPGWGTARATGVGSAVTEKSLSQERCPCCRKRRPAATEAGGGDPRGSGILLRPRGDSAAMSKVLPLPGYSYLLYRPGWVSSRSCVPGAWSSSWTMRTARTKATSSWPPSTPLPRRSPSWHHTSGHHLRADGEEQLAQLDLPQDGAGQRWSHRTDLHRFGGPARARPRGVLRGTARPPSARLRTPLPRPPIFARPGHIFPLRARRGGARLCVPGTPRPRWIWRPASRGSRPPASCAGHEL